MKVYVALISSADESSGHYVDCVLFYSYEKALDFIREAYNQELENHPDFYNEDGNHETDYIYDEDENLIGFCNYKSGYYSFKHYSIEIKEKELWDTDYANGQNQ